MFEKVSKLKLRWNSSKGYLTVEDLWDLSLPHLNVLAKSLKRELKEQEEDDFLVEVTEEDSITKLKFDVVLHILETKKDEMKKQQEIVADKAYKQKIMGLIAEKEDMELRNKSLDELKDLLKK